MGRPRKPTKLHILSGSAKHDPQRLRDRAHEPIVTAGVGEPPSYLGEDGRREWLHLTSIEGYREVLTENHRSVLEHYCVLYQRFVDDAKGEKPMSSSQRQTFHSLAMQMGITPASQSKISAPAPRRAESKWDSFANPSPLSREPEVS